MEHTRGLKAEGYWSELLCLYAENDSVVKGVFGCHDGLPLPCGRWSPGISMKLLIQIFNGIFTFSTTISNFIYSYLQYIYKNITLALIIIFT